jgi:23S rRNA pseudouridine1911/1915/1917 synthase
LIKNGAVLVDDAVVKPSHRMMFGSTVTVHVPETEPATLAAEAMPLHILYEDEHCFAVNKPVGVVVHPGAGNVRGTLAAGLLNYTQQLSTISGDLRPGLVHRLDKNTSGVLIVAKTDEAHWKLAKLFANRQIYKEYRALVWGVPEPAEAVIEKPIGRSQRDRKVFTISPQGRPARSRYKVLRDFEIIALLQVLLETGRTHQIRVHMKDLGHPVVGDTIYGYSGSSRFLEAFPKRYFDLGKQVIARADRQMLHAYRLKFSHPFSRNEIEIIAPIPKDMEAIIAILNKAGEWQ